MNYNNHMFVLERKQLDLVKGKKRAGKLSWFEAGEKRAFVSCGCHKPDWMWWMRSWTWHFVSSLLPPAERLDNIGRLLCSCCLYWGILVFFLLWASIITPKFSHLTSVTFECSCSGCVTKLSGWENGNSYHITHVEHYHRFLFMHTHNKKKKNISSVDEEKVAGL